MAKHAYSDRDDPERSSRHVTLLSWDSAFLRPADGIILQTPSTGVNLRNMFLKPRISEGVTRDLRGNEAAYLSDEYSLHFWKQYTAATSNVICVDDQQQILHFAWKSAMRHRVNLWEEERLRRGDKILPPVATIIDYFTGRRWISPDGRHLRPRDTLRSLLIEGHWYLGSIHGTNVRVSMTLQDWAAIATIVACVGQYDSLKSATVSFVSDVQWVVDSVYKHAPFEEKTIEYDGSPQERSLDQLQLFFDRRRMGIDDNAGLTPDEKSMNLLLENFIIDTDIKWDNG